MFDAIVYNPKYNLAVYNIKCVLRLTVFWDCWTDSMADKVSITGKRHIDIFTGNKMD